MSVEYFAFPDRRDPVGGAAPLAGEVPGDSIALVDRMREHAWQYPTLLVYREHQESRWSYQLLMPRGEDSSDEDG